MTDNYEACCLAKGANCPNCPAGVTFQPSRTYTKIVPVVSASVAVNTAGERLGEVLLTALDGDVDKETSKKVSAVRVPFQYDNKTPLKAVFKVDVNEDEDRLYRIDVAAVKLGACADGAADADKVKVTERGSGFVAGLSGTKTMCEVTAADAVGFVGTHNKDKLHQLELQPAPVNQPVAPTYERKVNDVYFKVATDTQVVYWRLDIVYDDACSNSKCESGDFCSVCTSSGIPGAAPANGVECGAALEQARGFTCGAADPAMRAKVLAAKKAAMDKSKAVLDEAEKAVKDCTDCKDKDDLELARDKARKAYSDAKKEHDKAKSEASSSTGNGNGNGNGNDESSANKNGGGGGDDDSGMIIGIVVALVLLFVVAVIIVLVLMSKNQQKKREAAQAQFDHYSSVENTTFDGAKGGQFQPGVTNPLYDWYHPKMSAAVARKFLEQKHEGAFIIRDSDQTSGWHKLCVKSQGTVVQDNIKQTHSGQYELVAGDEQQPKFRSLPDMVAHYSKRAAGAPYMLAAEVATPYGDEAPYDMSDGAAPTLPQKGAESLANPMYGADLSSGNPGTYADVDGPAGGYLDAYGA